MQEEAKPAEVALAASLTIALLCLRVVDVHLALVVLHQFGLVVLVLGVQEELIDFANCQEGAEEAAQEVQVILELSLIMINLDERAELKLDSKHAFLEQRIAFDHVVLQKVLTVNTVALANVVEDFFFHLVEQNDKVREPDLLQLNGFFDDNRFVLHGHIIQLWLAVLDGYI